MEMENSGLRNREMVSLDVSQGCMEVGDKKRRRELYVHNSYTITRINGHLKQVRNFSDNVTRLDTSSILE